jgi:hypothetical protein
MRERSVAIARKPPKPLKKVAPQMTSTPARMASLNLRAYIDARASRWC